jgi:hypothetical protein
MAKTSYQRLLEVSVAAIAPTQWEWRVSEGDAMVMSGYEASRESAQIEGDSAPCSFCFQVVSNDAQGTPSGSLISRRGETRDAGEEAEAGGLIRWEGRSASSCRPSFGRLAMPVMVMMLVVVVRTRAGDGWNGNCGENGDNQQVAHLNAPGFGLN